MQGDLLKAADARGSVTTHTYDSMDRLGARTDPLNRSETFVYDPNGNLTQFTDRKGQVSSFTYDSLNRRTRSDFTDATFTEFTYDAAGRLIQANDSQTGAIVEEYDVLDRLIRETTLQGTIQYAYDALGRRTTMTVDGQPPVSYSYDINSRLTQIVQGTQTVTMSYDGLNRRTLLTLPNGVSTEYQYDAASRLTALIYRNALSVLGDLTYQYDSAGNRIAVGGSFARTLLPDPVLSATYDAANQQLTFGSKTMAYDVNGNLTSITDAAGITIFTWDAHNRLASLSGPMTTASFQYDALDRRTTKLTNGRAFTYQYDDIDITREVIDGAEASYLRGLNIDDHLIRTDSAGPRFYLSDGLGSTLALADRSGILATTYTYDPFGRTTTAGAPDNNPFQFTGRANDDTKLYYYRARYYIPTVNRFISEDPAGIIAGPNFYSYALNTPINLLDPFGLAPKCPDCPGGEWSTASTFTLAAFAGFGGSYSVVSFTCGSNGLQCIGTVTCTGVGPKLAFTPGFAFVSGGQVVGATRTDQLEGESFGYVATLPPQFGGVSGSLTFTVTPERIFGLPVTGDLGIGKSWGLGVALIRCKTTLQGCLR